MEIISGIYKIENKINHKIYIGQSTHIYDRWKYHKAIHHWDTKYPLYKAFYKYGILNFDFSIIEQVEPNKQKLNEREIYWISYYDSYNKGYNNTKGGDCFTPIPSLITEKDIENIRIRKMNIESPLDVYQDYKENISWGTFDKIWNGKSYHYIKPEFYKDKEKLKYIEHILKQRMNLAKSPLTINIILDIRSMVKNKISRKNILEKYNYISKNTIDGIIYNKYYKEIQIENKDYIKILSTTIAEDDYEE